MLQESGVPAAFAIFFGIAVLFIVCVFLLIIGTAIYRWRAAKRSGLDPLAGDIQLMAAARNSRLLAPADPKARLAELDHLLADGAISPEEHAKAREGILGEI
jgi:hypothetical protein